MPGPEHLALICHIERLWPKYTASPNSAYFSLNVATTWVGTPGTTTISDAEIEQLLLWQWSTITQVSTRIKAATGPSPWQVVKPAPIIPGEANWSPSPNAYPLDAPPDNVGIPNSAAALRHEIWHPIEQALLRNVTNADGQNDQGPLSRLLGVTGRAPFIWDPFGAVDAGTTFRDLLGYTSTLPWPLSQAMNQSFCFAIPNTFSPGDKLYVAPQFYFKNDSHLWVPRTDPNSIKIIDNNDIAIWTYMGDGPVIKAYLNPWTCRNSVDESPNTFFSFGTYWVRNSEKVAPDKWNLQTKDRTATLESRSSAAFDLGQRIIDALRQLVQEAYDAYQENPSTAEGATLQAFIDQFPTHRLYVLSALHDIANVGLSGNELDEPGDLVSYLLPRLVVEDNGTLLTEAQQGIIRAALTTYHHQLSLDGWTYILTETLPDGRNLNALTSNASPLSNDDLRKKLDTFDQIQAALSDKDTLNQVVLKQWKNALAANGTLQDLWNKVRDSLTQRLDEIEAHKYFLRMAMDVAWRSIISAAGPNPNIPAGTSPDERTQFKAQFKVQLGKYFEQRIKNVVDTTNPYKNYFPHPRHPNTQQDAAIQAKIEAFADIYFDKHVWEDPNQSREELEPTPSPHAFSIQVDTLFDQDHAGKELKHLEQISGIGMLVRQRSPSSSTYGPWHSLNMVKAIANEGANYPLVRDNLIAPYRISFQNNLKNTFVTYDNEPLIAQTPRLPLAGKTQLMATGPVEAADSASRLLFYKMVTLRTWAQGPSLEWARLPGLQFGQIYEFLVHMIGNGGTLPAELSDRHPAQLVTNPAQLAANLNQNPNYADWHSAHVHRGQYLRRVAVGKPRFVATDGDGNEVALRTTKKQLDQQDKSAVIVPPVPDEVRPLAPELGQEVLTSIARVQRYFYDEGKRMGLLTSTDTWEFVVGSVDFSKLAARTKSFIISIKQREYAIPTADPIDPVHPDELKDPIVTLLQFRVVASNGTGEIIFAGVGPTPTPVTIPAFSKPLRYDFKLLRQKSAANQYKIQLVHRIENTQWQTPLTSTENMLDALDKAWIEVELEVDPSVTTTPPDTTSFLRPTGTIGTDQIAEHVDNLPLVLLSSYPQRQSETKKGLIAIPATYAFGLRRPSTDLLTWDRWVAGKGDVATITQRKGIWDAYHRHAPPPDISKEESGVDRSIDDPAAANFFLVELVSLSGNMPTQSPVKVVLQDKTIVGPNDIEEFQKVQSLMTRITCRCFEGNAPSSRLQLNGNKLEINLQNGEVAELIVHVPVKNSYFDKWTQTTAGYEGKFLPIFGEECPEYIEPGTNVKYRLLSSFRILFETATKDLPHESKIWEALTPAFLRKEGKVLVTLNKQTDIPDWKFVSNTTVSRQLWRWDGRSIHKFPFAQAETDRNDFPAADDTAATNAILWEVQGFGNRSEEDHLESSASVKHRQANPTVFQEELVADTRALYYRFSAEVKSRYAALLPQGQSSHSAQRDGATDGAIEIWKRLFVPCRHDGKIAPPNIKFIIPLTDTEGSTSKLPGFMVVLNEPWYEVGGLAEIFAARITTTKRASTDAVLPEFGPDPILAPPPTFTGTPPPPVGTRNPTITFQSLEEHGPGGFTFDVERAETPLFTGSWFILPPPEVSYKEAGQTVSLEDLDWYFAKIQFQRRLEGVIGNNASEWTKPNWIQYLPQNPRVFSEATFPSKLQLSSNGITLSKPVVPPGTNTQAGFSAEFMRTDYHLFTTWLLVTQRFFDARGRFDQERYIGLCRYDTESLTFRPLDPNLNMSESRPLQARLLTVQQRLEGLWTKNVNPARGERIKASYYNPKSLPQPVHNAVTLESVQSPSQQAPERLMLTIGNSTASLTVVVLYTDNIPSKIRIPVKEGNDFVFSETKFTEITLPRDRMSSTYSIRVLATLDVLSIPPKVEYQVQYRKFNTKWENVEEFLPVLARPEPLKGVERFAPIQIEITPPAGKDAEVRFLPPTVTPEPWNHFFPVDLNSEVASANPEDASARIVQVSAIIPILE